MNSPTLQSLVPEEMKAQLSARLQPSHTPIWAHWEDFAIRYLRTGKSEGTVRNVRDAIKFILNHSQLVSIEDFNDQRKLEDVLYEIMQSRHFSHSTFNTYIKNLKTYFIWLKRQELIAVNNLKNIPKYRETPKKQPTLNIAQVNVVVGHIMSRRQTRLERLRNIFFIDLLRLTAARPAELLQLTDDNITSDLEGIALTIHGIKQKGKPRLYALKGYAKDSYLTYINYKKTERPTEKKLFVSMSKRDGWTHQGVNQLMKRLSKELGFRVNCYGFRRSVATSLDEMELSLDEIGGYLGHTRRSTTLRYIQESTKRTMRASDIMNKIY
ncbi:MAG: site-specific integrase [Candidatus Gracilibacteria bacterium]